MDIGDAAAYRYPFVSAELTWTEHCSVPSSGRIPAISCMPPVSVEPIPPLDDIASRKIYCRRGVFLIEGVLDEAEEWALWPRGTSKLHPTEYYVNLLL